MGKCRTRAFAAAGTVSPSQQERGPLTLRCPSFLVPGPTAQALPFYPELFTLHCFSAKSSGNISEAPKTPLFFFLWMLVICKSLNQSGRQSLWKRGHGVNWLASLDTRPFTCA